jgi:hypothetical protein
LQLIQKNSPLVVNSHKLKFIFKKKAGRRHRKHRQTTVENGAKTGFEEACVAVVLLSSFIAFSALFLMDCYFFELFMRFFFCFFCIVWCFEFFPHEKWRENGAFLPLLFAISKGLGFEKKPTPKRQLLKSPTRPEETHLLFLIHIDSYSTTSSRLAPAFFLVVFFFLAMHFICKNLWKLIFFPFFFHFFFCTVPRRIDALLALSRPARAAAPSASLPASHASHPARHLVARGEVSAWLFWGSLPVKSVVFLVSLEPRCQDASNGGGIMRWGWELAERLWC